MTNQKNFIIFGACSAVAIAFARLVAPGAKKIVLVARNKERLDVVADDLKARSQCEILCLAADLNDFGAHEALVQKSKEFLGQIDSALVAHGLLGDQAQDQQSWKKTKLVLDTNFYSAASLLTILANLMQEQRSGVLAAISSVAGDRGRKGNYIYGAAKAGLTAFLSGLRNRLFESNVQVMTIKPGFIDTPMTKGIKKGALFVSPEVVAGKIWKSWGKKDVIYTPGFWRLIMFVICSIPEKFFKRLSI